MDETTWVNEGSSLMIGAKVNAETMFALSGRRGPPQTAVRSLG